VALRNSAPVVRREGNAPFFETGGAPPARVDGTAVDVAAVSDHDPFASSVTALHGLNCGSLHFPTSPPADPAPGVGTGRGLPWRSQKTSIKSTFGIDLM